MNVSDLNLVWNSQKKLKFSYLERIGTNKMSGFTYVPNAEYVMHTKTWSHLWYFMLSNFDFM